MHSMYRSQQAGRPFPAPSMSLSQRSKFQAPVKGLFYSSAYSGTRPSQATRPTSSPLLQHDAVATRKPALKGHGPAQYTLDNGPRDEPGTAAYYDSWTFRRKVKEGCTIVPRQAIEAGECLDDSADEDFIKKPKHTDERWSLVMVFSRTSVRRASTQRKVNERMQRSNRRMKFMRNLEKTKPLFKWD
ncbi:uncharacterized protein M421DRAFT_167349 [Didymella exigua CBS 183.55]|uniref:Uncharacterized protein n=1 Tax=Didymella exigua CBS 183.55 TaxID=1150837 RepID=A0A6A5RM62_9PLEO|nr:uncharacterized protein M421DRAFT_167349 [Didymella exigua CBS 183.55]KAF1928084.1 hypothetical protein M421DRAFT_167349 [Didymella exigua CBS 183.55]